MRRHLSLWVIVALAALLFACGDSNDNGGGGNPPAAGKGNLAVTVRGATTGGATVDPPSQIDVRLKEGDTVVDEWTPTTFESSGGNYTFTWADLDEGTYTLEADLSWNGSAEVTGSVDVTVVEDETTTITVDATPVDVVTIAANLSGEWHPMDVDWYTTPSGSGVYRPQWFRFGPIPANSATNDMLRVSISVDAAATGNVTLYTPGGEPAFRTVTPGATLSTLVTNPAEGYYWAMVMGPSAAANYRFRFVYPYTP